ncbi:hypothetical protein IC582_021162 [Cucumis melo]
MERRWRTSHVTNFLTTHVFNLNIKCCGCSNRREFKTCKMKEKKEQ